MLLFNNPKGYRKKKQKRYKKIVLKLSVQQMSSLESYCESNNISVNKFIKKSISHVTNGQYHLKLQKEVPHKRQMDLEDLIKQLDNDGEEDGNKTNTIM
ncbi:MAG: hypothetical protein CSA94_00040 [Bacteroidetes bacterium]|nr:MAG: hypothetical protein CSA94_00040 [Bacteroidota bacterium]